MSQPDGRVPSKSHPYDRAPSKAFWRPAVSDREPLAIDELWEPKFSFRRTHKIATLGSCFAQHFSRELMRRGHDWFNAERAPEIFSDAAAAKYNYGIFSARTGNIYTAAMLGQWVRWALGTAPVPDGMWSENDRFFDPFRPTIEPEGFASKEELQASRAAVLKAVHTIITESDRLVFTLGLTEGWVNLRYGFVYAACPGTAGGTFRPGAHAFKNYSYEEVYRDLNDAIIAMQSANPELRVLLTVSPVPLTATASGKHVLTATTYSKSVLRAVAGKLADTHSFVDYFPSYEIITGTPFQGKFYQDNKRSVSPDGVKFVMDSFFACLAKKFGNKKSVETLELDVLRAAKSAAKSKKRRLLDEEDDVVCEEVMLDAFAR